MTSLLFIDDFHAGDPLFLADLGRRLLQRKGNGGIVVFHDAKEDVERATESVTADQMARVSERAVREANQGIARRLIEEGVPAVSIQGSDRGLLQLHARDVKSSLRSGLDTGLNAENADWLLRMISLRSIPVVSQLVSGADGSVVADAGQCAAALAVALAEHDAVECVLFNQNRKRTLYRDGTPVESVSIAGLAEFEVLLPVSAARHLVSVSSRLVVANSAAVALIPIPGTLIVE